MQEQILYAYFAGAIDADGFISIQRTVKKSKPWHPTYHTVRVGFTGTVGTVVQDLLRENFGGSVYVHIPKNKNHKPSHSWQASGKKAKVVLIAIAPYLLVKQEQAHLGIEFQELMERQRKEMLKIQKPPYHITPEMLIERNRLWEAVTRLNNPKNRRVHFLETP